VNWFPQRVENNKLQGILNTFAKNIAFIVLGLSARAGSADFERLVAADAVLVPIQCEYLALEGVSELLDTLMRIRRTLNPSLEIKGSCSLCMMSGLRYPAKSPRLRISLHANFPEYYPRNVRLPKPRVSVSLLFL